MRCLIVIVSAAMLSGCALAARNDARADYQVSAANYKACVTANAAAPQNCESLRLIMETDERKYGNLAGMPNSVTIQNR